ncbi:hypothetical protein [Secundilactobacillus folii]|uniref:Uncharacterized protein n=1 Tax=Secundilactobacillus folii TaxID=2678357 RepID=A0A7X2XUG4_9LACO|nr:hypothetical protein [Secundilactobacillus folii]MTV81804.1 hypothetical protein [Secundilactobacillus folii]
MRDKLNFGLFTLLLTLAAILGLRAMTMSTNAAETRPVLLVYDSKNIATHADLEIDCCQRLMTSLGLPVKSIKLADYQKDELTSGRYQGVVTMKNWDQQRLTNSSFERDRKIFKGVKLHVGPELQSDERQQLCCRFKELTHQQLCLHQERSSQLLSASHQLTVINKHPDNAEKFGWLSGQSDASQTYAYGVKIGRSGFLPSLGDDGLSIEAASQLMGALFKRPTKPHQPLLTITGISPYTNMKRLRTLIKQFSARGYPFALSITSVATNTNLEAFHRYTSTLRFAEQNGGLIFLSPSSETGTHLLNGDELRAIFQTELASLGADHVFPVGVSAPGYWNQSKYRRDAVLQNASHVLLLPNQPTTLGAQTINSTAKVTASQPFKAGVIGLPFSKFETVTHKDKLRFNSPTSLLIPMPQNNAEIGTILSRLESAQVPWFDPIRDHLNTALETGSALLGYRSGQYWLNGEPLSDLNLTADQRQSELPTQATKASWMNRVIQWQSTALIWIFSAIGLFLAGLLSIGWRLYRGKFIRPGIHKDR